MLTFENKRYKTVHTGYDLPKVNIKDYNVTTDWRNLFDKLFKNYIKTNENVRRGDIKEKITEIISNYPYLCANYNRYKQTISTWYWSKSSTINQLY